MVAAFRGALAKLGWTEGSNLLIEYHWGGSDGEKMREQAAELATLMPDVIFVSGGLGIRTIASSDPSRADCICGCPRSTRLRLRREPVAAGRQRHRLFDFEYSLSGKWLELPKEIAPDVTRAAVLRA